MDLTEIRTFVAVAERGSVNRAAHALHLSQPAVTRHVQRLESALGVRLLDRRARPATLTPAGRAALERCRQVLAAVDELRLATANGQEPSGNCRIGFPPYVADATLTGPVDHVRRAFPKVTLQITTKWSRALLEQVRAGGLDSAVVQLPETERLPADVSGQPVASHRLLFVAPRDRRMRRTLELQDLAAVGWVLNAEGCGFRATLLRALQRINAPLQVVVEAYGSEMQLSLVARGVGFGLVPAWVLARSPLRSRVQVLRVRGQEYRLTVWTVRGQHLETLTPVLDLLDEEVVAVLRRWGLRSAPRNQLPGDSSP